ncbi:MAG: class II aldolase/adducin family protein [Beijerinckiaceae bacterium]|nr:class II aldolase/adducin family protein [Beijerinckiaceae bacterium]MCI0735130.1 class II aldolase/adducin family protein [Beijerinckiaceae bacterium]
MNRDGINQGMAGNISVRWKRGLLITPSGIPYDVLALDDIIFMNRDGSYEHRLAASSEWRFHRDILLERPDVNAVVHAHPIYATAFAMCGMEIPAVHYMIAVAGGPTIPCACYATYGSPELSKAVLEALRGRNCALIGNHGMVATGRDLVEAMWRAAEVETLCKQYAIALQLGTPRVLGAEEIERTIEKFKQYGPRRTAFSNTLAASSK